MTKTIAILPVRNEEWILESTLATLELLCDHIVVADQRSEDSTPAICAKFPKVQYLENHEPYPSPKNRRSRLLEVARDWDGLNVILAVDADEILTATALGSAFSERCEALPPGGSLSLPWVMLWKDPLHYRVDSSIWSRRRLSCVFRDDRHAAYPVGNWHESRLPPLALSAEPFDDVAVLHYQFVAWQRTMSKQAHCRVLERLQWPRKPSAMINNAYVITKDERDLRLQMVPDAWVRGWIDRGIDVAHIPDEESPWFDAEIFAMFENHGPARFADLDIWDIDWEAKRLAAIARDGVLRSSARIEDPRSREEKIYHWWLNRFMSAPVWRQPGSLLRPIRALVRRMGVTRNRLRRLGVIRP